MSAAGLGAPASSCARGAAAARSAKHHYPRRQCRQNRRAPVVARADADADASDAPAPKPLAVVALLLEVDGAVVDVVQQGHRVAFNRAFAECGLPPAAAWDPPSFEAALRAAPALGGTGEALVAARLDRTGAWPPSLPDEPPAGGQAGDAAAAAESGGDGKGDGDGDIGNGGKSGGASSQQQRQQRERRQRERQAFARRVHEAKQRAFAELLSGGGLPLRPDVASVVDAALAGGAVVALVAETATAPEEGVAAVALRALGAERAARVRVLTAGARRPRDRGEGKEEARDDGGSGGGGGTLEAAVARHKAEAARAFARALSGGGLGAGAGVGAGGPLIDVSALTGSGSAAQAPPRPASDALPPAFFRASAALLGASPARCVCVAATGPCVRAAAAAGMVSVAVPRLAAFDASFPEARAKFEAFGPGYITWARLAAMVEAPVSAGAAAAAESAATDAKGGVAR